MKFKLFLLFLLLGTGVFAQQKIEGKVRDSLSGRPLAFVSISVNNDLNVGAMTDIEGNFSLIINSFPATLNLHYVGYRPMTLKVDEENTALKIRLSSSNYSLREMVIIAGENPAHRIIRTTWKNRDLHDPAKRISYTCDTYNKLLLTGEPDTLWKDSTSADIKKKASMDSIFEKQHLFLMESETERLFLNGKVKENVLGSKISGLKEASFLMLAMKFQPFSFYGERIEVSGKNYLNPISKNSEDVYAFTLEDTLFSGKDTTYVISFQPKKGKLFASLEGTLFISAPDYAISNVIASPTVGNETVRLRMQQQYIRLSDGSWFPEQLNTDIDFVNVKLPGYKLRGRSTTFVNKVNTNPNLKASDFSEVIMDVVPGSSEKKEPYWEEVRIDQLSAQEQETYRMLDSISKAEKFDKKIKGLESFLNGYLPIKAFNLDYDRLIRFNSHEGFRLGAGGITNNRFSNYFAIGGYYAYGFKDKASKYGLEGRIYLLPKREVIVKVLWSSDVREAGGSLFIADRKPETSESSRMLLINRMDKEELTSASISLRFLKYITSEVFVREAHSTPLYAYSLGDYTLGQRFSWLESGVLFKIAWKEEFYRNGRLRVSLGTKAPIYRIQIMQGQDQVFHGALNYTRVDFRMDHKIEIRRLGTANFQLNAGVVDGKVPLSRLFTGKGNFNEMDKLRIGSMNAFETMGMNEYISDRYVALFFRQDFGSIFKIRKFKPAFSLVANGMIGGLHNPQQQHFISNKQPSDGFFEAGLQINSLLRLSPGGYGIGGFYRFGASKGSTWKDNIALKLMFSILLN